MIDRLNLSSERLRVMRAAYRDACLELGLDPSERALTVRVAIVERLLTAIEKGEHDIAALTELCVGTSSDRARHWMC